MILEQIKGPNDIKKIKESDYELLAKEIRRFLIDKVSRQGGHLASNLGVVELTMALHLVLDLPQDKIVWDVGHQAYTHKILTGRQEGFDSLRAFKGMSGFPKRRESACDSFDTGHSSTSISAAAGILEAQKKQGNDPVVVAVIGDGALTGGMAFEGLNNIIETKGRLIIILNDNEMSISPNVGGLSKYLFNIRSSKKYHSVKQAVEKELNRIPVIGPRIVRWIRKTKSGLKAFLVPGMFFENMGISYWGPIDGHNVKKLVSVLRDAKEMQEPVLIHVMTKKGKGYWAAEIHPEKYHGVAPFEVRTGEAKDVPGKSSYTSLFGQKVVELASADARVVAITAAMEEGTGLIQMHETFPDRFYDVGIAEQHAVTFAAGLAVGGMVPIVAVYSSFLQRAYDQVLHDVAIQELPVVFALDRAGLVGSDGETHHGVFDLSYLSGIPNIVMIAPKNGAELGEVLAYAVSLGKPVAVRYPRGTAFEGLEEFHAPMELGKSEVIYEESDIAIFAVGSMMPEALAVREALKEEGCSVSLVNVRFVKPFDKERIAAFSKTHGLIVTMEENVKCGGYGEHVASYVMEENLSAKVLSFAIPDQFVEQGTRKELLGVCGLDCDSMVARIKEFREKMR